MAEYPVSHGVMTVAQAHNQIHNGELYEVTYTTPHASPIADDANLDILLVPGSATIHLEYKVAHGGDAEVLLYEGVTASDNGTEITSYNMNRNSDNTPTTTVHHTPTVSDTGTNIHHIYEPGGTGPRAAGGTVRADTEWVLAPNTVYLLRVTNRSGTTDQMSIDLQWYES